MWRLGFVSGTTKACERCSCSDGVLRIGLALKALHQIKARIDTEAAVLRLFPLTIRTALSPGIPRILRNPDTRSLPSAIDIPTDLWMEIMHDLEPRDILSLRQVRDRTLMG